MFPAEIQLVFAARKTHESAEGDEIVTRWEVPLTGGRVLSANLRMKTEFIAEACPSELADVVRETIANDLLDYAADGIPPAPAA